MWDIGLRCNGEYTPRLSIDAHSRAESTSDSAAGVWDTGLRYNGEYTPRLSIDAHSRAESTSDSAAGPSVTDLRCKEKNENTNYI